MVFACFKLELNHTRHVYLYYQICYVMFMLLFLIRSIIQRSFCFHTLYCVQFFSLLLERTFPNIIVIASSDITATRKEKF